MNTESHQPITAGRATIRLTRKSEWFAYFRRFRVFIDDVKVGDIKRGRTAEFVVAAGRHSVYVKIDWCPSKTMDLDLSAATTVDLICGAAPKVGHMVAAPGTGLPETPGAILYLELARPEGETPAST